MLLAVWATAAFLDGQRFCRRSAPTDLHRAAQRRITLNAQVAQILAGQQECDCGEPSRTEPNQSHPAENRKVGGSIPSLPTRSAQLCGLDSGIPPLDEPHGRDLLQRLWGEGG
jgi:hypothetical protein